MSAITVGELQAALPGGTVLLGGRTGLSRAVRGTATFRARTPAFPALHGGELALVSLALLRQVDPNAGLDRLITQLAPAGIAGVVLLDVTPPVAGAAGADTTLAARAADEREIPVFLSPTGVTADAIELAVHRRLAGHHEALLRRSQQLQQEFTQLALAGSGMNAIVERLAAVTGFPAAWESPTALEPLAWAAPPPINGTPWQLPASLGRAADLPGFLRSARLPLQRWGASRRTAEEGDAADVHVLPLRADADTARLPWQRLVVETHPGGTEAPPNGHPRAARDAVRYLSVFAPEEGRAEVSLALSAAGLAASIEMLRARTVMQAQGSAVASLVHDWLAGRVTDADLAVRAAQPGLALTPPYAVLVLETERPLSLAEMSAIATSLAGPTAAASVTAPAATPSATPGPGLPLSVTVDESRTVLIVPTADDALETAAARVHGDVARRAAAGEGPDPLYAGIGRAAPRAEDVPRAYSEALQALAVARRLGGRHRVAFFGTLGVYRVLASTDPAELAAFRRETLGPLLSADERQGGELLRTLETYLLCGASPQETALRLHTHRNTVLYRLQRIGEALGGADVRAPEVQFTLWLAVRAGDVLGEHASAAPTDRSARRRQKQAVA
jgi:sugar diacid utilization regulator